MDGTVAPSRQPAHPEMIAMLNKLMTDDITVAIASGSHNKQMAFQMAGADVIKMGQNGNHCEHPTQGELWFDTLTAEQKEEVFTHTTQVWEACTHEVPDENDLLEDRGSQISLSIYGHHADPAEKKAFDGDFKKRTLLLEQFPFVSDEIEVKMGGSTCLDYFKKGRNKGHNINRLITEMGWDTEGCLFFGDALFPGGNDESVVGIIETRSVTDEHDCLQQLQKLFI